MLISDGAAGVDLCIDFIMNSSVLDWAAVCVCVVDLQCFSVPL